MSKSIVIEAAALSDLEPATISSDWILAGTPEARSKMLVKSRDRTSSITVWECTADRFNWHYSEDETVVVISGEVFITAEQGEERRLGQGDVAFFPAGSSCTWRITDPHQKGCHPTKGPAAPAGYRRPSLAQAPPGLGAKGSIVIDAGRSSLIQHECNFEAAT
jgi:uncharacterized cupin superfamily protein